MEKRSSPPKKLKIKGQPHKLAYINDVEEGLLRARGGSGEMVHGIPAFYDEGDDYSPSVGVASDGDTGANKGTTKGDDTGGWSGGGNEPSQNDLAKAVAQAQNNLVASLTKEKVEKAKANQVMVNSYQNPYAKSGLTVQDMAFNIDPLGWGSNSPQRIAASYMNSLGSNNKSVFAPSVFSSKMIGGDLFGGLKKGSLSTILGVPSYSNWFSPNTPHRKAFADMAIQQMKDQQRLEKAGNVPSPFGKMIGTYNVQEIMDDLANGGRPVLDETGKVQGAFSEGLFGEVYQGNQVEGLEETGWSSDDYQKEIETRPVNPLTGQCDEGYFFDEDLQACRMGSATASTPAAPVTAPATGAYYRPTGLETASAFTPAGFDYDAANSAFLDSYAYRPENYQDPMSLNGFKQII
jgi:hypothetical protein